MSRGEASGEGEVREIVWPMAHTGAGDAIQSYKKQSNYPGNSFEVFYHKAGRRPYTKLICRNEGKCFFIWKTVKIIRVS